jgi:hypothetical protein
MAQTMLKYPQAANASEPTRPQTTGQSEEQRREILVHLELACHLGAGQLIQHVVEVGFASR